MSDVVFPTLPGLAWSVTKIPEFSTIVKTAVNGAETRIALWSAPRWHFLLKYEFLRDDATGELKKLAGFFLQRQGQFEDFLYLDPDDNMVAEQALGQGDGKTAAFTCLRNFGGYLEPIGALDADREMSFAVGGVAVPFSISGNQVVFATAPAAGLAVTGSYGFHYRVRFADDKAEFEQFMHRLWQLQSCELVSVK
ncbi:MAG TPA: DUF2460 domain-containing protein [Candidatus Sulfotelmatobacter sp.]|jgi:uncharacterized protein (TIGR02217 family)|nr:DUF2460 domain-containing protein [Candidatus Sulfotelmatobacter sp.]